MTSTNKNPGSALQRATGEDREFKMDLHSQLQSYATCSELQSRHIERRYGIGRRQAAVIAGLFFGEDR